MTIIITIIALLLLASLLRKISLSLRFRKQVKALYENLENISDTIYSVDQISDLPAPVQRYFNYALKSGQRYISSVKLIHTGLFKTAAKKSFISITGVQYFTAKEPQFIWKGKTLFFTAIDSYIGGRGNLKVLLLNLFPVVNVHGSIYNEGELQRWVAESIWFPTNLLPSETISWLAINDNTAKLYFRYKDVSFNFIVTFNAEGQIIVMETQRFMTDKKRETWICKMSDYKEMHSVKIPFSAEASWKLPTGDYSYAKFKILKIEYNNRGAI